MNIKRRLLALEGERKYDGIGAVLDALETGAPIKLHPDLAAALNGMDDMPAEQPASVCNRDLPL